MSIVSNIKLLNDSQKGNILVDLEIENVKKQKGSMKPAGGQLIYPYHIDENTGKIILPYFYAKNVLALPCPQRKDFEEVKLEFTGELREYQNEVKKRAIQLLNSQGCCLLALHVGWGKSIFAIYLATKLNFKTVIILNKLILVKQWLEEIDKRTMSKGQFVKPNSKLDPTCDFYVINAINVPKMGESFFSQVGTCIIDEIHLIMAEKMFQCLQFIHPRYVIGLSATPYRPDGLNKLLDIYCGEERIVEKLNKEHTVYCISTGFRIPYELQPDGKIDWNSVLNNQANHPERNRMIVSIVKQFPKRNFLILCKRIQHGQTLLTLLKDENEDVTELLGNTKQFDSDARILIATSQKCGVGFSHNKLDALIIASDMEEYFIQYLGRVFRNPDSTPLIFDLVDEMSVLQKHYQTRRKTYINAGGTIINIKDISKIKRD